MRFASLLGIISFLILAGCEDEPKPTFCLISPDASTAYCIDVDSKKEYQLPIKDLSGFIASDRQDFSDIKAHHRLLHQQLSECESGI